MSSLIRDYRARYNRAVQLVIIQDFSAFERYIRPYIRRVLYELNQSSFFRNQYPMEITLDLYIWLLSELYEKIYGLSCTGHHKSDRFSMVLGHLRQMLPMDAIFSQFFLGPRILRCSQSITLDIDGLDLRLLYFR